MRQFATLISAGIPIIQSCDLLEKSTAKTAMRLLLFAIKKEILAGNNLVHSIRLHSRYFDELTCQLIEIGEHTGKLDMMLITIANHREKQLAFKTRLRQALFYPCIITITAFCVAFSMFFFIIPKFAELFNDMLEKIPLMTRWIFYFSSILHEYFWFCCCIFFFFVISTFYLQRSGKMNSYIQQLLEKLPYIKQSIQKILLAKFARNLAITFDAGIPITDGLKLTVKMDGNTEFAHIINRVRLEINLGRQLHQALLKSNYFPILMVEMVKTGEESGELTHMLNKIAEFFESDVEQVISMLSLLLEPLIMIVLGVLIGGLIIGIYLPIFKLGSAL